MDLDKLKYGWLITSVIISITGLIGMIVGLIAIIRWNHCGGN